MVKSAASRKGSGEAQCCGGFIPGGIGCWREKTPARCRYIPDNITGANLEPRPLKNSRETLSLQHRRLYDARRAGHGFWHDLAAPVIAGILASMIVNWLNKRK
ncbi:type I toxin-antitoxin system toxin Ldr family protein [Escherichia coli O104:H4]|nr:type I toxin-antitoxin system toxin Ldr family protein [Escherichia coli]EFO0994499.1 type I toxin-antitoxin system toxin Ldr family protein [Escherichia coli]EGE3018298.1 type I toxin-antitoxin system toxin Ldr family protein [Escherichia coli]QCH54402.1 type I toxin-antitoxin system toxin Ldr family protein [Escherichia coli O104:H4]TFX69998.1 type I toxin-antitoxin system toxin Ldr family protein [Escherichia coli]